MDRQVFRSGQGNELENILKSKILSYNMWEALSLKERTHDRDSNLKYPFQVVAAARAAISSLGL